ncbi:uncharacterized protein BDV14DRAFT_199881 [Aspergillus stella-maris]|uniref:uncharacterized protein n=1 Tax=Aspergillus stella-maris TaxID=1810926 RepID=UPI003CCCA31D
MSGAARICFASHLQKTRFVASRCRSESAIQALQSLSMFLFFSSLVEDLSYGTTPARHTTQRRKSVISTLKSSVLYAASQSASFLCIALAFWYGGWLVVHEGYSRVQFFIAYAAVIAGAFSAGATFSFAPDMSKSRQAAQDIKALLDRRVCIDACNETKGERLPEMKGDIELRDVVFRYPTGQSV